MTRVFALGQERAQCLSAGFMAAMTLSMLTTPWLLQRFGYRHTNIGVVLLLMFGGVAGGLGSWFELVLAPALGPSVGGLSTGSAGGRSSSWWCRFALSRWCSRAAICRSPCPAMAPRTATARSSMSSVCC